MHTHQSNNVPTHNIDGQYIKEWLLLGPFFPDDLDTDFLASAGGEANVNPCEGDAVTTSDGRTLRWKRHHSAEKAVDLIAAIGVHEYATAYAFCVLRNDSEGNGVISLGSDDGGAVWISGHRVHRNPKNRALVEWHGLKVEIQL